MIGGMAAAVFVETGLPLSLSILLSVGVAVLVGLVLHKLAIEPARGASAVTLIIITIGASILLRGVAGVVFDKRFHSLPPFGGREPWQIGGAAVLPQSVLVLLGTGVIVVALWLFMAHTLTGKALIATASNRLAARLVGINTDRIVGLSFAVSAGIGAIGGILMTPITLTSYD